MPHNKRRSNASESFIANLNTIFESWTEEGWKDDGKPDFPERKNALRLITSAIRSFIAKMEKTYPNLQKGSKSIKEILDVYEIKLLRELPNTNENNPAPMLLKELESLRKKMENYRTGRVKNEIRLDDEPEQKMA